jgi:hypothetical protein
VSSVWRAGVLFPPVASYHQVTRAHPSAYLPEPPDRARLLCAAALWRQRGCCSGTSPASDASAASSSDDSDFETHASYTERCSSAIIRSRSHSAVHGVASRRARIFSCHAWSASSAIRDKALFLGTTRVGSTDGALLADATVTTLDRQFATRAHQLHAPPRSLPPESGTPRLRLAMGLLLRARALGPSYPQD